MCHEIVARSPGCKEQGEPKTGACLGVCEDFRHSRVSNGGLRPMVLDRGGLKGPSQGPFLGDPRRRRPGPQ
jgi:hypothetical protein